MSSHITSSIHLYERTLNQDKVYIKLKLAIDLDMANPNQCIACGKRASGTALIQCSVCRKAAYCSPQCQVRDEVAHEVACIAFLMNEIYPLLDALDNTTTSGMKQYLCRLENKARAMKKAVVDHERTKMASPRTKELALPPPTLDEQGITVAVMWMATLSHDKAFDMLIDSYRLRADNEYRFEGKRRGLYIGGAHNKPIDDFRQFLRLAEKANVLPRW